MCEKCVILVAINNTTKFIKYVSYRALSDSAQDPSLKLYQALNSMKSHKGKPVVINSFARMCELIIRLPMKKRHFQLTH